jgi:hypothetical protein
MGGFAVALSMLLLGIWGVYIQWQPLLDHGVGPGSLGKYIAHTFTQFCTVALFAGLYGYSNLRIYLP